MSEIIDRVQQLSSELRAEGISISSAELVEVIKFISKFQVNSLTMLKSLLKINLIKHQDQLVLFDVLFEKYFPEFYGKVMDLEEVEDQTDKIEMKLDQIKQERLKMKVFLDHNQIHLKQMQQKEVTQGLSPSEMNFKKELESQVAQLKEKQKAFEKKERILQDHNAIQKKKLQMQEKLNETLEQHEKDVEDYFQQLKQQEDSLEEITQEVKEKLDTQELCIPPERFDEQEQSHGGQERHQEIESSGRELEETQKSNTAHEEMRQKLHKQQSEVKQFIPQETKKEHTGSQPKSELGVKGRENANLENNTLLQAVMNRFRNSPIGEKQFVYNILNNSLTMAKNTILQNFRIKALQDKEMLRKVLNEYIKLLKEAVLSIDVPLQEKREIYHEILNRVNELQQYDYQKELLKQFFLNKPKAMTSIHFKDLQHLYETAPNYYDIVMKRMEKYVLQLSRVFRNKKGLRYKEAKLGTLDVARTISYNLTKYGDEVGEFKYRKRKYKKTNFFVLCDVSFSVNHVSELFLIFLRACSSVFNELSIYLFVDHIHPLPKIEQYAQVYQTLGGYSNMRIAFWELAELKIPKDFTLLILTDCRTNQYDTVQERLPYSYESLLDVRNQVKQILILNPEPKEEWQDEGGGGSALTYMNYSKVPIMEFYNLECMSKLIKVLEKIT